MFRRWTIAIPLWLIANPPGQSGARPAYRATMLRCAVFREQVRTDIRSAVGATKRSEEAGRDGVLFLRAADGDSGLGIVAWYDWLTVWRLSPEGRVVPETDGLLGGRWRGLLSPAGRYAPRAVPFIPEDVAEITELRNVLDDFLPLLPDSALAGGTEHRWTRSATQDSTSVFQDSLAVPVHRDVSDEGRLLWDAERGPVRWERAITVTARIPPGRPFARGMTSVVRQRITVERVGDVCDDREATKVTHSLTERSLPGADS